MEEYWQEVLFTSIKEKFLLAKSLIQQKKWVSDYKTEMQKFSKLRIVDVSEGIPLVRKLL